MKRILSRALLTVGAAGGALLLATGVASAHVSVAAPGAEQGGYSVLTFRVPTESETAGTTAVTVQLPNLKSARTEPMPGWTSTVQKDPASATATSVTWTADPGVSVGPGQFQQFVLSAGPLPEQGSVEFPTTQTYSDGTVVQWDQKPGADGSEPDKPAPTLTLAAGSGGGKAHAAADTAVTVDATTNNADTTARWLGGIGLVLGALGTALGIGATIRNRRS
ncbi:YcnI family protein [Rhodococcus sp. AG1013]|uniref:YcnI family copper-binding membrane protein n=1 Tax=unclassified Rhodococcus (in: high G+C Gram-positive bacteria) TaxID=192944 RepID=UPI000E0BDD03|nr:YcnI family protein [Rhodococcus sp. AG1013]RDI16434.1 uncharacterized protein YcnI [Rhodococcus sp. AG1013]